MVTRVRCFDLECTESYVSIDGLHHHGTVKHPHCSLFKCRVNEHCVHSFDKWFSFRKHLISKHGIPKHFDSNMVGQTENSKSNTVPQDNSLLLPVDYHMEDEKDFSNDYADGNDFFVLMGEDADRLVAKAYSKPGLPRNHVDNMINDFTSFLSGRFMVVLKDKISKAFDCSDVDPAVVSDISDMLESLSNPFSHLSTEYLRLKHFKSSGDYIPPQSYVIESRVERNTVENSVKLKMRNVTGQFIPLRQVLKKFFELPDALSSTIAYMEHVQSQSEDVSNFIQCQKWKTIREKLYKTDDVVMPLVVYYDDWEPNNALGCHSEKIGCVYANLPCLPPACQAKLENIFEALLFHADDRKLYGNARTFKPLIEELKYLESEGVLITIGGETTRVYFATGLIIRDNLGLNAMCGFVECFSANFPCRFCKATKRLTETMCVEDSDLLRNPVNYTHDVALNDVTKTGIKEEMVFKEIQSVGLDVTTAFGVDAMHDGPEGVGHYTMIPVLMHFHKQDPIFLETLNSRVYMFDYGPNDGRNRPTCITPEMLKKNKLKMTASEMTLFVRYFGLFVGDLVDENDKFWQLYLLLRDIFDILQAKTLPDYIGPCLTTLVQEHNQLYMSLTGQTLKPKHHFLLHYSHLFLLCGPFAPVSSIRNEGRHKILKAYTNNCMSRRNVLHSLAVKRQLALCFRFVVKDSILPKLAIGSGDVVCLRDSLLYPYFKNSLPVSLQRDPECYCAKWVELKGTRYQIGMVLIVGTDQSKCLQFAEIQMILVLDEENVLFICTPLLNLGLNAHIRGFEVVYSEENCNLICVKTDILIDPCPLSIHSIANGERYVVPKYFL